MKRRRAALGEYVVPTRPVSNHLAADSETPISMPKAESIRAANVWHYGCSPTDSVD